MAADGHNVVPSCTILTTEANDAVRPVHRRMPVILKREVEELWLGRSVNEPAALASVLTLYPANDMEAYPVSSLVNSDAKDVPEVIARTGV